VVSDATACNTSLLLSFALYKLLACCVQERKSYHGDDNRNLPGQSACTRCTICPPNAWASGCSAGSTADSSECSCNAGFYGDGFNCNACKLCDIHAKTTNACSGRGILDTVVCQCNSGYYGDGIFCTECKMCDPNSKNKSTSNGGGA
jgi:hypothetical protein